MDADDTMVVSVVSFVHSILSITSSVFLKTKEKEKKEFFKKGK